jgi:ribosomal protein S4
MVLFRMRLLPTIFACNQFIKHQGVLVNNEIITLTNYRIKIGDILSLSEKH